MRDFLGRAVLFVAVASIAVAAWQVKKVFLILFGGLIVACILAGLAGIICRHSRASHKTALASAILALTLALTGLGWLIGDAISAQLDALKDSLPRAVAALQSWLQGTAVGRRVLEWWQEASPESVPWSGVVNVARLTLTATGELLLMLMIGVFIAAEPQLYRDGAVRLVAPSLRERLAQALDDCAAALQGWLKGQALSMVFVGIATGVGLALLGVPLALALGLLAGVLDFVPFFGPIAAGIVAVLFAFTEGPDTALYVAILMVVVQQVESQLVVPLAQRWAVALPPVLGLVAVLFFATWFGLLGILFATPLMVVVLVLVRKLYVEGFLEDRPP